MFTHILLPENFSEKLASKLIEAVERCKIFKKNTPFADLFAIKLNGGARSVFQSVRHPEHGHVLLWLKNFLAFQHGEYVQYLDSIKPAHDTDFSGYCDHLIFPNLEPAAAAAPAPHRPASKQKKKNKKGQQAKKTVAMPAAHDDETVEVRVAYRNEILQPSDAQVAIFDTLIQAQENICITGGAGAGKTLLAEKALIALAPQSNQLVYLAPTHNLAREMLASMHSARIANVSCLSLSDIAGALDGKNTFHEIFPDESIDVYEKICQLAALKEAGTNTGAVHDSLKEKTDVLDRYKIELNRRSRADFNISGTGFPFGLLRAADSLIIDEFQQFSFPLLSAFNKLTCRKLLFGDYNQAVNITAQISLHYMQSLGQQCVLPTTFRVPSFVAKFANALLRNKSKKFSQKTAPLLITTDQKAGNIYWCEQKTLTGNKIAVSINTAVVYLDADDFSWASSTFNASNLYSAKDILGLEFDNIIVILSPRNLKTFLRADSTSKAESLLSHSAELSLYSALYVVLTRAKQNLLLITNHRTDAKNFFEQHDIQPTPLTTSSQVKDHFDSKDVTIKTIVQYINNEVKNGNLKRGEQLFRQHWARPGADFVTFCVAHSINISPLVSPEVYSNAIMGRAKMLLMGRHFTAQETRFFAEHQSTLVACSEQRGIHVQLLKMFTDTFCFSGLVKLINASHLSERTRFNACRSMYTRFTQIPFSNTKLFNQGIRGMIEIINHSENALIFRWRGCTMLSTALDTPDLWLTIPLLNSVFLSLIELITNPEYDEEYRGHTLQTLISCIIRTILSEAMLGKILQNLNTMMMSNQYTKKIQYDIGLALHFALKHVSTLRDTRSFDGIILSLMKIITTADHHEIIRTQAILILHGSLELASRRDKTPFRLFLTDLIKIILCNDYTEMFRTYACQTLTLIDEKITLLSLEQFDLLLTGLLNMINDNSRPEAQLLACKELVELTQSKSVNKTLLNRLCLGLMDIINNCNHPEEMKRDACNGITICLKDVTLSDTKPFADLSTTLDRMKKDDGITKQTRDAVNTLSSMIQHRLPKPLTQEAGPGQ
jgi:hypothetical protein